MYLKNTKLMAGPACLCDILLNDTWGGQRVGRMYQRYDSLCLSSWLCLLCLFNNNVYHRQWTLSQLGKISLGDDEWSSENWFIHFPARIIITQFQESLFSLSSTTSENYQVSSWRFDEWSHRYKCWQFERVFIRLPIPITSFFP